MIEVEIEVLLQIKQKSIFSINQVATAVLKPPIKKPRRPNIRKLQNWSNLFINCGCTEMILREFKKRYVLDPRLCIQMLNPGAIHIEYSQIAYFRK